MLISFRHPSEKVKKAIVRVSLQCERDTQRSLTNGGFEAHQERDCSQRERSRILGLGPGKRLRNLPTRQEASQDVWSRKPGKESSPRGSE